MSQRHKHHLCRLTYKNRIEEYRRLQHKQYKLHPCRTACSPRRLCMVVQLVHHSHIDPTLGRDIHQCHCNSHCRMHCRCGILMTKEEFRPNISNRSCQQSQTLKTTKSQTLKNSKHTNNKYTNKQNTHRKRVAQTNQGCMFVLAHSTENHHKRSVWNCTRTRKSHSRRYC